jgi:hypothetical protein
MRSILSTTAFAATLLPLTLLACGGSSGDDDGQVTPTGAHTHYVVNTVTVPTTSDQANADGLDLGGPHSNKPDMTIDNTLGHVLAALTTQGFDVKTSLDEAVDEGNITLLADFQTTDFTSAAAAGLQVLLGDNPMPAPCGSDYGSDGTYDGSDATVDCGKQFSNGSFSVSPSTPTDALLAGPIVGGTFNGGPGNIELQIALGGTQPVDLNLTNARAKATGITATAITNIIVGGMLSKDELDTQVLPAIQSQLVSIIARDCTDPTDPPTCGCASGSTGSTILGLFDGDLPTGSDSMKDCMVDLNEIENNSLITSLLAPDVCSTASCAMPDSLSIGIAVTAVAATYTVSGETSGSGS